MFLRLKARGTVTSTDPGRFTPAILKEHAELSTYVVGFPCGLAANQDAEA
jgi:hypothetical protein